MIGRSARGGGRIENHFHQAELEALAVSQDGFLDRKPVNKGAVGGVEILDDDGILRAGDLTMEARNRRVFDLNIIGIVATQPADTGFEVQLLRLTARAVEQQFRHNKLLGMCITNQAVIVDNKIQSDRSD